MKHYFTGNKPIKKCWNYISKSKQKKADNIVKMIVKKIYPHIEKVSNTDFITVGFDDNIEVIEFSWLKIALVKSYLHPNSYIYSFIC